MEKYLDLIRYSIVVETNFSKYHILWIVLLFLVLGYLLIFHYDMDDKHFRIFMFITGILFLIGEIIKLLCVSINGDNNHLPFLNIPWQFCSTPLYYTWIVALIKNKKVHQAFLTYLATYCLVAGCAAFFNAETIFSNIAFNNFHTLFLHGGMILIALYILITKRLDLKYSSFIGAIIIFIGGVAIALLLNTICHFINPLEEVDLFFINPFQKGGIKIVQDIRNALPYGIYLTSYILFFTLAAFIIFLGGKAITKIPAKNHQTKEQNSPSL